MSPDHGLTATHLRLAYVIHWLPSSLVVPYRSSRQIYSIALFFFSSLSKISSIWAPVSLFFMAGKERIVKQWHALMEGTGFRIEIIIGLDNPVRSIIEVVLREYVVFDFAPFR